MTALTQKYPIRLLLGVLFISQVFAITRLHKGPTDGQSERVLRGRTLSSASTEDIVSNDINKSPHEVDFSIHIKKDVILWNELVRDDVRFKPCWFETAGTLSDITLAGKNLDVTDFKKDVVFAIEQEDLEFNCKSLFKGTAGIDKSDHVLFYMILDVNVINLRKIQLKMMLVPGKDVVPLIEFQVHEDPALNETSFDGFELNDKVISNSAQLSRTNEAREITEKDFFPSFSRQVQVQVDKKLIIAPGVAMEVSGSFNAHVFNFRILRLRELEVSWEQAYSTNIITKLKADVAFNDRKGGELSRNRIKSLKWEVDIPFLGMFKVRGFTFFDWFAELNSSADSQVHIDGVYRGHEEVTVSLNPPRYNAVSLLAPGSRISATAGLSYDGTGTFKSQGFFGVRPRIGISVLRTRKRYEFRDFKLVSFKEKARVRGDVGIRIGLDVQTALENPIFPPFSGSGPTLGFCADCHLVQAGLNFVGKDLRARLILNRHAFIEKVIVTNVFNRQILTACLVRQECPAAMPRITPQVPEK